MTASAIARLRNGATVGSLGGGRQRLGRSIPLRETNALVRTERRRLRTQVFLYGTVLAVLVFLSLCPMGAQGQYYVGSTAYALYTPAEVARALYYHGYQALAQATHWFDERSAAWLAEQVTGYEAVWQRMGVVAVTLVCAVLLSVSGMLFQTVFKNPIAGPGLLGVSTGTSIGVAVLVLLYGAAAPAMVGERCALCYGFGAAILAFVLLAGRRLSRKGRSLDVVSLLLIGSIVSQLLGFVVSYITLFVLDETDYAVFFEVSQMLVVDTSPLSWTCLAVACVVSLVPVYLLRYRLNALAFDEDEARLWGLSYGRLRTVALLCGSVMILAAQVHTGMVGMVSLVVPFLARRWFGCETSRQLTGCVCISTILLLACRDLADLIPFVGDGLALGSVVGVVALPLFLLVVGRQESRRSTDR